MTNIIYKNKLIKIEIEEIFRVARFENDSYFPEVMWGTKQKNLKSLLIDRE